MLFFTLMQEYYRYQKVHKIVVSDEVLVIFNPKKHQSIFQVFTQNSQEPRYDFNICCIR